MLPSRRMVARTFVDLVCWQLARDLEGRVYAFTAKPPASTDYEYCRQIRKSSSSAPRNMAEGFGRYLAGAESGYLSAALYEELRTLADRAIGASVNLTKYLESCRTSWR